MLSITLSFYHTELYLHMSEIHPSFITLLWRPFSIRLRKIISCRSYFLCFRKIRLLVSEIYLQTVQQANMQTWAKTLSPFGNNLFAHCRQQERQEHSRENCLCQSYFMCRRWRGCWGWRWGACSDLWPVSSQCNQTEVNFVCICASGLWLHLQTPSDGDMIQTEAQVSASDSVIRLLSSLHERSKGKHLLL